MASREPMAFLSYVHSDDEHDDGKITQLRKRLEGELKVQLGRPFSIFQDRNDIAWGQRWSERIDDSLAAVTFFIPVVTPSFFQSVACRNEFAAFVLKERQLGLSRLILPLYYVTCAELSDDYKAADPVATLIRSRQYEDWRPFRFTSMSNSGLRKAVVKLAEDMKAAIAELEAELAAAKAPQKAKRTSSPTPKESTDVGDSETSVPFNPSVPESRKLLLGTKSDKQSVQSIPYYAYTREFDEIASAESLSTPDNLLSHYKVLAPYKEQLLAEHQEQIETFISEIGPSRMALKPSVTLLLDNSGSLRGQPILYMAAWASIIAETLGRAEVYCEVLGFTTRTWKGGMSREKWISDGRPKNPGRLNDLRHIVYKPFDKSIHETVMNFGLMAREGILKENVDGEALLWAFDRLKAREDNKLLIFVSDGAPVDDATLNANRKTILEDHLRATAAYLREQPDLRLHGIGIGIGHDLARYIANSDRIENLDVLGLAVLKTVQGAMRF